MDRKTFDEKIALISKKEIIPSKTGVCSYKILHISIKDKKIVFKKDSEKKESIDIDSLYKAYIENDFLNTKSIKKHIKSYNRSPAIAILMAAGLLDENGNRINEHIEKPLSK